jgi:hypothetical protein
MISIRAISKNAPWKLIKAQHERERSLWARFLASMTNKV